MDFVASLWDLAVHLDQHLAAFVAEHGAWVYALLFVIVFCETGLVVTPFLPGDSLLFVVGALAAAGGMSIALVIAALVAAALCGDNCNYWIGRWTGTRLFARWINPVYLKRTHDFYERHGGKTIVTARFMPIVRTYVPFVAGARAALLVLRIGDEGGLHEDRRHVVRLEHGEARLLDARLVQVAARAKVLQDRIPQPQAVIDGRGLRQVEQRLRHVGVAPLQVHAADEVGFVLFLREQPRHLGGRAPLREREYR